MRFLVSVCLSLFVCSSCLIVFSEESINSFAFSGGQFMTPAESLEVFGSEISFSYYNGTDYSSSVFRYNGSVQVWGVDNSSEFSSDLTSYTYLRYISDSVTGVNYDTNYITVDISPSYSIFDTEQIHSCIALSSSMPVSTVYQSPSWDWVVNGSTIHTENDIESSSGSGVYAGIDLYSVKHTFVPFDWSSQSSTSGYSLRATFSGNNPSNGVYFLLIACPYISSSASGSNGTFPITTTSNISVNVDIDMTETNGLLSGIRSTLSGIVSGIAGIFIPSDDDLQGWLDDMEGVYHDTFGQYAEIDELLDDVEDTLLDTSPSAVVEFPALSIPNTSLQFQARSVNLVRSEYSGILDIIKWAFDIAATCLFVNTMKKKLDEIILGKTVVELEGDD